jgi:hypothetical protein
VSEIPEHLERRLFKEENQEAELAFLHKLEAMHRWMNINKRNMQEISGQRYIGRASS